MHAAPIPCAAVRQTMKAARPNPSSGGILMLRWNHRVRLRNHLPCRPRLEGDPALGEAMLAPAPRSPSDGAARCRNGSRAEAAELLPGARRRPGWTARARGVAVTQAAAQAVNRSTCVRYSCSKARESPAAACRTSARSSESTTGASANHARRRSSQAASRGGHRVAVVIMLFRYASAA